VGGRGGGMAALRGARERDSGRNETEKLEKRVRTRRERG